MIDTTFKQNIYDRVSNFFIVVDWKSDFEFNATKKMVEEKLPEKKLHFVLIASEEVKEKYAQSSSVTVLTKKALNIVGKWKNPEELSFSQTKNEKIVVYFCTETNKLVNKLKKSFEHATDVSYMNEKMTNFDLSFRVKIGNEEELLNQTKKYLKRL